MVRYREPVRMQVLVPGCMPVEVLAWCAEDARIQAAALVDAEFETVMKSRVAVHKSAKGLEVVNAGQ